MAYLIHECTRLAAPIGRTGAITFAILTGHLELVALLVGCAVMRSFGGALWEGIRPHVVTFGSASASAFFGWLRRKMRLPPELDRTDHRY
jgi:hypothetical protein